MNPQAAGELVHLWLQAHDDPASVASHRGPVSRAVRELAPDGHLAGVGQTPSGPAMVVLLHAGLLVLPGPPARRAPRDLASPSARGCVHLTPGTVDLEVTERFEDRPDLTGAVKPTRVHLWQLHTEGLDLRIDGTEVVHRGRRDRSRTPTRCSGRAIAGKLGWQLP